MKKAPKSNQEEMRPEYDFSGAIRSKYAERFARGTNLVLLEPDVARAFPNADAVNDALRLLLRAGERVARARYSRTAPIARRP